MNNLKEQLEQKQAQAQIDDRQNPNHTKNKVLTLFASRQNNEATEILVGWFKSANKIYTIRDDREPEMWIYKEGIYEPEGKSHITEFVRSILGEAYTTYRGNQVISKIQADTFINQDKFFKSAPSKYLVVENGILNLDTKELQDFTHEIRFFNKVPVEYNPDKDCKAIKQFFKDVLGTKDDIKVIQEIFGWTLWDEYFIEKAVMMLGSGRNGKGKTLDLMKRFIGADNCAEITLHALENDGFAVQTLMNKKANLCGDLSRGVLKNTGIFKKLTGRDLVSANRKHKKRVNFVNHAKFIFSANELPITRDITPAFFSRWILINYPYTFLTEQEYGKRDGDNDPKLKLRDPSIIQKIVSPDEMSGLLNWALEGLTRLRSNFGFSSNSTINETKREWLRTSSSINAFIMDCVKEEWDSEITKSEFRTLYHRYCQVFRLEAVRDKTIKKELSTQCGVTDGRRSSGSRTRIWKGINWKPQFSNKKPKKDISVQDVQDVQGFWFYIVNFISYAKSETMDCLDNLDKISFLYKQFQKKQLVTDEEPIETLEKIEKTHYPCHNCGATPSEYLDKRSDTFFCDECKAGKQ